MLPERVFFIGGGLCLAAGGLWIGYFIATGDLLRYPVLLYPAVLFLLFGGMFVAVGAGARRYRRDLLRSGERGESTGTGRV